MTDDEQKKIFAKNLLSLLEKNGKSQREVAGSISISPQTFNTWCQGIALPRMGKIQKLADYFNVDKTVLLDAHSEENPIQNIQQFHGPQKALNDNYEQLSDHNKKKVVDYSDTLLKVQKMEEEQESLMPQAAHERTDTAVTAEMIKHDDDIMDDSNF